MKKNIQPKQVYAQARLLAEERFKDYFDGAEPTADSIADCEIGKGNFIAGYEACLKKNEKAIDMHEELLHVIRFAIDNINRGQEASAGLDLERVLKQAEGE